jgi:transcriptional regulator with XRE-family HTH domain
MKNKSEVSMIKEAMKINRGIKIKEALKTADINQSKLANNLGITRSMISNWISGQRNPSLKSLDKISKATGVPLKFFLDSSENIGNISGNSNIVFGSSGNIIGQESINTSKDMELLKKENELLRRELEIVKREKELAKKNKN